MSSTKPFTLRWGIIATGGISTTFAKDLLVESKHRNAPDVQHVITAVGSRSIDSARAFIEKCGIPDDVVKGFGSYEEVYASPDVDVIYIGTPHTSHYQNARSSLLASKHVLIEKPITFSLPELDSLLSLARSRGLFLMEAVWTRFHPIAYRLQEEVFGGKWGRVKRLFSDLSNDTEPNDEVVTKEGGRIIDPSLGGGALLDLGPYPMVWAMLLIHQNPLNQTRAGPVLDRLSAHMKLLSRTGVDESTSWVLEWSNKEDGADGGFPNGGVTANLTASISVMGSRKFSGLVQMEKADIEIGYPAYRPQSFTIIPHASSKHAPAPKDVEPITVECPISPPVWGIAYQADEVARCIRDGKTESERMPWEESRIVMGVFDKCREAGGYPTVWKGQVEA